MWWLKKGGGAFMFKNFKHQLDLWLQFNLKSLNILSHLQLIHYRVTVMFFNFICCQRTCFFPSSINFFSFFLFFSLFFHKIWQSEGILLLSWFSRPTFLLLLSLLSYLLQRRAVWVIILSYLERCHTWMRDRHKFLMLFCVFFFKAAAWQSFGRAEHEWKKFKIRE